VRPGLNARFTTIGIEQQAHGHTADIDRPLSYAQSADDTAAALAQLGLGKVDVFGFSDGGNVGLALALRHPARVGKLAVLGTQFSRDGLTRETWAELQKRAAQEPAEAAAAMPARLREAYEQVAPRREDWSRLVSKVYRQAVGFKGWSEAELRGLRGPLLVMVGDRDAVTVEHAARSHGLVPDGALAVLPVTEHVSVMTRPGWLVEMLEDFLVGVPSKA